MQAFEVYIKKPTPFMIEHWQRLLPDWSMVPQSLVLILLRAQFSLDREGEIIETEKDRLLGEILKIGDYCRQESHRYGYRMETISPKNGFPLYSSPGTLIFDSVAAVNYGLGFPYFRTEKGCKILTHPQWQRAVYPGLLLSVAPSTVLASLLALIIPQIYPE